MEAFSTIGIDLWSMVLHLVNIVLLVVILTFLLYKPLLKILDQRQKIISLSLHEAENLKREFEKKISEMKTDQDSVRAEFEEQMRLGKKSLETARGELIAEMEEKKRTMIEETTLELAAQKAQLLEESQKAMITAMGQIIHSVVQNTHNKEAIEKSIVQEWHAFVQSH